jgi:hypothetical protein
VADLLLALTYSLADQRAFGLAGYAQKVIKIIFGVGIEPDCEWHGPDGLTHYYEWNICITIFNGR